MRLIGCLLRRRLPLAAVLGALVLVGAPPWAAAGAGGIAPPTSIAAPATKSIDVPAIIRPVPTLIFRTPIVIPTLPPTETATATTGCSANLLCPTHTATSSPTSSPTRTALPTGTASPTSTATMPVAPATTPTPPAVLVPATDTPLPTTTRASPSNTATPAKKPSPVTKAAGQPLLILSPTTASIGQVVAFKLSGVSPTTAKTMYVRTVSVAYYEPLYRLVVSAPCQQSQNLTAALPASIQGTIVGTFQDFVLCRPGGLHSPVRPTSSNGGATETIQVVKMVYSVGAGYQDAAGGSYGSATLAIRATTLAVTGKTSGTLRLHGSGFQAGEYVALSYSYGQILPELPPTFWRYALTVHAGAAGAFTVDIPAGSAAYGRYDVAAVGLTSSFSASAAP